MQLERELEDDPPSAWEVAEYAAVVARELGDMAHHAGLDVLARSLFETERLARSAIKGLQPGNAAPDDAA